MTFETELSKSLPKRFSVFDEFKQVPHSHDYVLRSKKLTPCSISTSQKISDKDGDGAGQTRTSPMRACHTAKLTQFSLPRALWLVRNR